MSSPLQIRNVPDETRRILKERAAVRGESLNSYLVELLDLEASTPTMEEVLARAARRTPVRVSSADVIRTDRDARRRR